MTNYSKHYRTRNTVTPQSEPIPGREDEQKQNNAGGFVFQVDEWAMLDRFLILGCEGNTYYCTERKMTLDNAKNVQALIKKDGLRVVNRVVEISDSGRAPKNDPALFVLALCASAADVKVRQSALQALPKVARTGTHLFHFAEFANSQRGWGRALKTGIANWYNGKSAGALMMQLVKYQQREGWSHRDLLRLSHPQTTETVRNTLYKYVVKPESVDLSKETDSVLVRLAAAKETSTTDNVKRAVELVKEYELPREVVNTALLNSPDMWEALLPHMGITAMLRNLGKMSAIGFLKDLGSAQAKIVETLTDKEALKKSRVHPLSVLVALNTYKNGRGVKGSLTWTPVESIIEALDDAFYLAFDAITPTNKHWLLGVDVSGSMDGGEIAGMAGISPRVAAGAMAMVTAKVEKQKKIMGFSDRLVDIGITSKDSLGTVIRKMQEIPMGGTDCALPVIYALKNKLEVDAFCILTDNETWAGSIHPCEALEKYRKQSGIDAKLIVVGFTATEFSIADKNDKGMLDVVGFDSAAPALMADFVSGGQNAKTTEEE